MYLLDINICIALIQGNGRSIAQFNLRHEECYLCTVVLSQLYKGIYCSQKVEDNLRIVQQFSEPFVIVPFESAAAIEFGKNQGQLRRIGKPTGNLDAAIAAIARSRQDIIVTNNTRHFVNIPNIQLENWLT